MTKTYPNCTVTVTLTRDGLVETEWYRNEPISDDDSADWLVFEPMNDHARRKLLSIWEKSGEQIIYNNMNR